MKPTLAAPEDRTESPLETRYAEQLKRYFASEEVGVVNFDYTPDSWHMAQEATIRTITVESQDGNTVITLRADEEMNIDNSITRTVRTVWFDRAKNTEGSFIIEYNQDNHDYSGIQKIYGQTNSNLSDPDSYRKAYGDGIGVSGYVYGKETKATTREDMEHIIGLLEDGHVNNDITQKSIKILQDSNHAIPQSKPPKEKFT